MKGERVRQPKQVTSYTHPSTPSVQQADTKPGDYYVTVRDDAGRTGFLLGPFTDDHAGALARVGEARDYVTASYTRAAWWAFGTARLDTGNGNPEGKLNEALGLAAAA